MVMHNNLNDIEERCTEIINSPYMRRELPPELLKLRLLLTKVEKLAREDVPSMASEIKHLRSQNKRLEAEAEALHPSLLSDSLDRIDGDVAEQPVEQSLSQTSEQPAEKPSETSAEEPVGQVKAEDADNKVLIETAPEGGR